MLLSLRARIGKDAGFFPGSDHPASRRPVKKGEPSTAEIGPHYPRVRHRQRGTVPLTKTTVGSDSLLILRLRPRRPWCIIGDHVILVNNVAQPGVEIQD